MNNFGQLIDTLARSEVFKNYESAFGDATNMPLALRKVGSWQLPFRGRHNESQFCAMMAESSANCAAYLQFQEKLEQAAMEKTATKICAYGLCETAVPVRLGSNTIGFLKTGQVMRLAPTEELFQRAAAEAERRGAKLNETARGAFFETPVVSKRKFDAVSKLLEIFSGHLSMIVNQLSLQAKIDEPLLVVRTRLYIQEHYQEDISLGVVSTVVHTNRFSLCKAFHKFTGLTFTEYINRTRIEEAKRLFLNPNFNISEIGFGAGFQSLTHFNRMFKKFMGESPSKYRHKLPKKIYPTHAHSFPSLAVAGIPAVRA
jgi:AraC-like DNA-binding protein